MNKHIIIVFMVFLLAALLVFSVVISNNSIVVADTPTNEGLKTISASGEGAIKVSPDIVYITLGVVTEGKDLKVVQEENATKMNNVIKSLIDLGIKKENIKTLNYNINPKYDWENNSGNNIVGYNVSNNLEVTINDIAKSGELLDKVVASGSNRVNNIRFGIQDETEVYNQALEIAVKDAKNKAIAMGKGLGITNIEPLHISEIGSRYSPAYLDMGMDMVGSSKSIMENTPISGGELEVSAKVNIEFTFK